MYQTYQKDHRKGRGARGARDQQRNCLYGADSHDGTAATNNLSTSPASGMSHGFAAADNLTLPISDMSVNDNSMTADVLSSSPTFSTAANNVVHLAPLDYAQQYDIFSEYVDLLRNGTRALVSTNESLKHHMTELEFAAEEGNEDNFDWFKKAVNKDLTKAGFAELPDV